MFWHKKQLSEDYVDLSIGRVWFKPLTSGLLNKATIQATINKDIINYNLYMRLIEYYTVDLSERQLDNLSVSDGQKVRGKIREILIRHGIITEEKDKITEEEKRLLASQFDDVTRKWGINTNGSHS